MNSVVSHWHRTPSARFALLRGADEMRPPLHLWFEAYALPEFGYPGAVGDYVFHVAGIVNVRQQITIQNDEISALSFFHGSQLFVEAHRCTRKGGVRLDCQPSA